MSRNMLAHYQQIPKTIRNIPSASDEEMAFLKRAARRMKRAQQVQDAALQRLKRAIARESMPTAYLARLNAIKATVAPKLTKDEWEWIKQRYSQRCAYCRQITLLTKDHILPLSKGGQHTKANIIPACRSCNSRKGNRPACHYNPLYLPYD